MTLAIGWIHHPGDRVAPSPCGIGWGQEPGEGRAQVAWRAGCGRVVVHDGGQDSE